MIIVLILSYFPFIFPTQFVTFYTHWFCMASSMFISSVAYNVFFFFLQMNFYFRISFVKMLLCTHPDVLCVRFLLCTVILPFCFFVFLIAGRLQWKVN